MNNTILIDGYLQNEMSAGEKAAFENQLAFDKELQEEFNIQRQIIKAAANAGLKNEFDKAVKKRIITRRLIWCGIIVAFVAAFIFYAVQTGLFNQHNAQQKENEKGFSKPENFVINNSTDTIIETRDGIVFAIPANAFKTENGNIELEIKNALTPEGIINYGLSTMSNDNLLQTAGMFSINGFADGKLLMLNKDIAVSIPAKEINPAMQLFDGAEDSAGKINWVNPRPIEKKLRTYDISTLDFYPQKYIPTLQALNKDYQNKKYTDSLYYSFSGYPHSEMPANISTPEKNDYPSETSLRPDFTTDSFYHDRELIYQIDPAKIQAIWNKQFNNTIIATKEFEERLRYMHSLCAGDYLEAYIKNLDKPLYESDQLIADNTAGEIKEKFSAFAARKDGAVMIAGGMQEKLSKYFQQKSKAYREAAAKTWAKYQAKLNSLNKIADAKKAEEEMRNFTREENNFNEELCINLTDAYKQIGIKRNCNDTIIVPPTKTYYNVIISTAGWKNLDMYVFDATQSRQGMVYTDPATGKTAKLTYHDVNIKIENEQQFDRVLVYLIPDSLSSFQLMPKKENGFKESLNALFKYNAVVLAYKGEQAYFYQQAVQPKEYIFSLSPLSEKEIKAALKKYSFNKTKEMNTEFEYRLFEQKETLRQLQLQKNRRFRTQVAASIFNCPPGEPEYESIMNTVDSASIKK